MKMNLSRGTGTALAAVASSMTLFAGQAHAAPIWDGDAANGTGVFAHIGSNCAAPSSITTPTSSWRGKIWRYHKPVGSPRCESKGIALNGVDHNFDPGPGATAKYYLGWESRLSSTVDNNAIFQWKSYPNADQNWPVVLKMIDGKLTLIHRPPNQSSPDVVWQKPIAANDWNHIVLGLNLSDRSGDGSIELWFNGQKQTFTNNLQEWKGRTWDSANQPKWGLYGAEAHDVTHDVEGLKVGRSYDDVKQ
ncbi:heparin lyase I family protein [Streptomyces sp. NPDC051567]|uniref:heparin lyase I family protein n=1 Tax=Streptomyces sp. NPDC051567 TaxID=3365660 RepID=UPI00379334B5